MLVRRSKAISSAPDEPAAAVGESQDRAELRAEERRRLALAQADSRAFGWFFERYDRPVLLFLRSMVPNHADAQELHDRVFLLALQGLGKYRWRGAPYGAYLHRIAANEAASYWRSRRRRLYVEVDGTLPLRDPRADALEALVSEEEARRLREAIAGMNESDQTVLTMFYWNGLRTEQIAAELQEPPGTIQARLKRARGKLERTMTETPPPADPATAPEDGITWLQALLKRQLGLRRGPG